MPERIISKCNKSSSQATILKKLRLKNFRRSFLYLFPSLYTNIHLHHNISVILSSYKATSFQTAAGVELILRDGIMIKINYLLLLSTSCLALSVMNAANAKVCFITDQEPCSGYVFEAPNKPVVPPSPCNDPNGCDPDPNRRCELEGYKRLTCNEVEVPYNLCPYDKSYFEKCVCDPNLIACNSPYQGVGKECGGKYRSCCNTCPGYDYTSIPSGYVSNGECNSCGGKKYKIKENPCNGFSDCPCDGDASQGTCLSGTTTKYRVCKSCCAVGGSESCTGPTSCANGSSSSCKDCDGITHYTCNAAPSCAAGGSSSCTGSTSCSNGYSSSCKDCNGTTRYTCNAAPSCSDTCPSYTVSSPSSCSNGYTSCYDTCYGKTWYKCNAASSCVSGGSSSCSGPTSSSSCTYGTSSSCKDCSGTTHYTCKSAPSCVSGGSSSCSGQTSKCSSNQTQKSSCKDCSGTMHYTCEDKPSCVSGGSSSCSGQTSSCGSGQVQTSSCKDCSGTMHYSCRACSNSCSSGSTSVSCSSNQNKVSTGKTECGNTCYKCENKPCTPTKTSCPSSEGTCVCDRYEAAGDDGCGNTVYRCRLYRPTVSGTSCARNNCYP